ncbi:hypothetical protein BACCOPRO_03532 [Phocaeicola coprophilus DSM 18228 = JCM 13818]|uniref:Uncharacterized protein n=1 Tax=Phocaeicola coprophilus DSM 18228 = JCM 13818 TaxID=547042 RepID=S0FCJ1_9BACT|nr:hypothetical protein BACCOPRO_03532 [Phocaeicola coprophilus DSM 18228 = JCM 13818]
MVFLPVAEGELHDNTRIIRKGKWLPGRMIRVLFLSGGVSQKRNYRVAGL